MLHDIRFALRELAKAPGFAVTAVVTLALGIGANTVIFSLVYGVLLKPLPFETPGRLVSFKATARSEGVELPTRMSVSALKEWSATSTTLERFAIYRSADYTVGGHGDPERAEVCLVSEGFFGALGTAAIAGRALDARDAGAAVAVISYDSSRRRFGESDPVGRVLRLDGRPYTIVGAMPRAFAFPSRETALWIPRIPLPTEVKFPGTRFYHMIARLKVGATLEQARAEAAVISARLQATDARFSKNVRASVERLDDAIVGDVRRGLLVLLAAVGAVLLAACVNVGCLCLARGAARHGDLAVRSALGASRLRLVRELAAESLVVVVAGGVGAWTLAAALLPAAIRVVAPETPRLADVEMDLPVLAFTLVACVATALMAGVLPAWRISRVSIRRVLGGQSTPRGATRTWHLRAVLSAVQAAVAVMVVVAAVLFARTLGVLLGVEPDRGGEQVVTLGVTLPEPAYAGCDGRAGCEKGATLVQEVLARVRAIGGVQAAAIATSLPPKTSEMSFTMPVRDLATDKFEPYKYQVVVVDGDFFDVLGIRCVRGRLFDERDTAQSEAVFVAGRDFARRRFGTEDVVGRQMPFGPADAKGMPTPATLIGVVDDVRYGGLERPPGGALYFLFRQQAHHSFHVIARTYGSAATLGERLRTTVRALDPEVPMAQPRTLAQLQRASVASQSSRAVILGSLAALALLLVGVGLYANIADMTTRRTFEIGVRMALGADARATVRMLVVSGLAPVAAGLAVGLVAALGLSRLTTALLFGVRPTDPVTYALAAGAMALVAVLAIAAPARRAVRIDPALALRGDP
ncbi:MAG: ADOP family duplicated permease [Vicinamibacterales bacterium]